MKIDLQQLRNRAEYISEQKHPTLDLIIWNYNQRCQFAHAWDEYTMQCRGLITDLEGAIVARPFKKFFNVDDERNAKMPLAINPIIYPKFDGSLGILYWDTDNKPWIATRGSFGSEQAAWASIWLRRAYETMTIAGQDFDRTKTYLFEIIYPQNRIVVDYRGLEELVLLAVVDTETGEEIPYAHEHEAVRLGLNFAQHIKYLNAEEIVAQAKTLDGNEEGWVFHWPTAGNIRLKIKGDEYVRLHRILTGFSTKSIWEALSAKQKLDELLERVPDEFFAWVREQKEKLELRAQAIVNSATMGYDEVKGMPTRKEQAIAIHERYADVAGVIFAMLDGKDPQALIWRQLKPKYEKPFKHDIDA